MIRTAAERLERFVGTHKAYRAGFRSRGAEIPPDLTIYANHKRARELYMDLTDFLCASGDPLKALAVLEHIPPVLFQDPVLEEVKKDLTARAGHVHDWNSFLEVYGRFADFHGALNDEPILANDRYHQAYDLLKERSPIALLEVGCGEGSFSDIVLADDPCRHLTIADTSDLGAVSALLKERHGVGRVATHRVQEHMFDWPRESYDCVLLMEIIEHVTEEQQVQMLREAASRVNPSGFILLSTPLGPYWTEYKPDMEEVLQHTCSNSVETLKEKATCAGCTIKRVVISAEKHIVAEIEKVNV